VGSMPTLRDVVSVMDQLYNPAWADSWDAVGLVAGDLDAEVTRVLFAVDPVQAVVDQAVQMDAQLLITHHPLWLKGVTSVAASSPKGKVVHSLISNGVALLTCHTNADCPPLGVSESMAFALGLTDVRPLDVDADRPLDKWAVFVPQADAQAVANAMHEAGAGVIGDYDRAQFQSVGTGSFRPLNGANPTIGQVGEVEFVPEIKIEVVASRSVRDSVRAAMVAAHPYEEVAYDLIEMVPAPSNRGSGRIGSLPHPMKLRDFAEHVRGSLPAHHSAVRIAGDPDRVISTVGLCGGSGDFLLPVAQRAGADVYVTSDLKHHPVSEHCEQPGACAVIDVPHWAAEATWLPVAAKALGERLENLDIHVSQIVTDPWMASLPGTVDL
jgi:dinuclear metal center YbgI/SA1388 family protein